MCLQIICFLVVNGGVGTNKDLEQTEQESDFIKRIIGGAKVQESGRWPWLVSIQAKIPTFKLFDLITIKKKHIYCGGSLINKRWVLTAAHCFKMAKDADNPKYWEARLATVKLEASLEDWMRHYFGKFMDVSQMQQWNMKVEQIIMHPEYDETKLWINDIALMKLSKDVPLDKLPQTSTANLPTAQDSSFPADGQKCVMTGWGCQREEESVSDTVMEVVLPKFSDYWCGQIYNVVNTTQFCAGHLEGDKGVCTGDSGGPLVCENENEKWIQVGVASFTAAASGQYPGVFTRVSSYVDWINNVISQNK